MSIHFKILNSSAIEIILPLLYVLNNEKIAYDLLKTRLLEMFTQNYECVGMFSNNQLIGITGLWFCTRHYSGKSVEIDHVYILENYRRQGLGKTFFEWISNYVKTTKNTETMELNTYVQNTASHKFYHNQNFHILGFHFLKRL